MPECPDCGEDVTLETGEGVRGETVEYCPECGEVLSTHPRRG